MGNKQCENCVHVGHFKNVQICCVDTELCTIEQGMDECKYVEATGICNLYREQFTDDIINKSEYILNGFSTNRDEHGVTRKCIFTSNKKKALDIINSYDDELIKRKIISNSTIMVEFSDGSFINWVKPTESAIGYRCSSAWIDKDISTIVLNTIVFPCCIYCSRDRVEVI